MIFLEYNNRVVLCAFGCTSEEVSNPDQKLGCLHKEFLKPFTIEPGQCVTLQEWPDKTFTLLNLGSAEKREYTVPSATIGYSFKEENSYQEWFDVSIDEDYQEEGITFSGRFHIIVDDNVPYTIYVDDIEFTETETEYIFKKLTVRFADHDPEY